MRNTVARLVAGTALVLLAGGMARAGEPTRVEGGDPSVNGAFLHPYTNQWRFSIERPGSQPVEAGTWSDLLESTSYEGRPALKRTQIASYKKGLRLTFINVFDARSMAPLTFDYARSDTQETRHLEVDGKTLSFRRNPGTGEAPAQDYVARVDRPILDFYDGMYGILLDSFPLREGYEATFPAFDTDRACIDWVELKVTGKETVPAGDGKSAVTWVVHVETKTYGSSTWWLTREAPYVIKATLVLPPNEGGATITYTMI